MSMEEFYRTIIGSKITYYKISKIIKKKLKYNFGAHLPLVKVLGTHTHT